MSNLNMKITKSIFSSFKISNYIKSRNIIPHDTDTTFYTHKHSLMIKIMNIKNYYTILLNYTLQTLQYVFGDNYTFFETTPNTQGLKFIKLGNI